MFAEEPGRSPDIHMHSRCSESYPAPPCENSGVPSGSFAGHHGVVDIQDKRRGQHAFHPGSGGGAPLPDNRRGGSVVSEAAEDSYPGGCERSPGAPFHGVENADAMGGLPPHEGDGGGDSRGGPGESSAGGSQAREVKGAEKGAAPAAATAAQDLSLDSASEKEAADTLQASSQHSRINSRGEKGGRDRSGGGSELGGLGPTTAVRRLRGAARSAPHSRPQASVVDGTHTGAARAQAQAANATEEAENEGNGVQGQNRVGGIRWPTATAATAAKQGAASTSRDQASEESKAGGRHTKEEKEEEAQDLETPIQETLCEMDAYAEDPMDETPESSGIVHTSTVQLSEGTQYFNMASSRSGRESVVPVDQSYDNEDDNGLNGGNSLDDMDDATLQASLDRWHMPPPPILPAVITVRSSGSQQDRSHNEDQQGRRQVMAPTGEAFKGPLATTWRTNDQRGADAHIPIPRMAERMQRARSPEPQPPESPRQEGWNCEGCNRWRPFKHAETLCPQCGGAGLCLPDWASTWHDVYLATPSPAPQIPMRDRRSDTAAAAARPGEDEEEGLSGKSLVENQGERPSDTVTTPIYPVGKIRSHMAEGTMAQVRCFTCGKRPMAEPWTQSDTFCLFCAATIQQGEVAIWCEKCPMSATCWSSLHQTAACLTCATSQHREQILANPVETKPSGAPVTMLHDFRTVNRDLIAFHRKYPGLWVVQGKNPVTDMWILGDPRCSWGEPKGEHKIQERCFPLTIWHFDHATVQPRLLETQASMERAAMGRPELVLPWSQDWAGLLKSWHQGHAEQELRVESSRGTLWYMTQAEFGKFLGPGPPSSSDFPLAVWTLTESPDIVLDSLDDDELEDTLPMTVQMEISGEEQGETQANAAQQERDQRRTSRQTISLQVSSRTPGEIRREGNGNVLLHETVGAQTAPRPRIEGAETAPHGNHRPSEEANIQEEIARLQQRLQQVQAAQDITPGQQVPAQRNPQGERQRVDPLQLRDPWSGGAASQADDRRQNLQAQAERMHHIMQRGGVQHGDSQGHMPEGPPTSLGPMRAQDSARTREGNTGVRPASQVRSGFAYGVGQQRNPYDNAEPEAEMEIDQVPPGHGAARSVGPQASTLPVPGLASGQRHMPQQPQQNQSPPVVPSPGGPSIPQPQATTWHGTETAMIRTELVIGGYPAGTRRDDIVAFQQELQAAAGITHLVTESYSPSARSRIGIMKLRDPTRCTEVRSKIMEADMLFRGTTRIYVQYGKPEQERTKYIQFRALGIAIDEARPPGMPMGEFNAAVGQYEIWTGSDEGQICATLAMGPRGVAEGVRIYHGRLVEQGWTISSESLLERANFHAANRALIG